VQYSVCLDALFQGQVTADMLFRLKQLGYDLVEWGGNEQRDIVSYKQMLEDSRLLCYGFSLPEISLVDASCHTQFVEALHQGLEQSVLMGNNLLFSGVGQSIDISHESQLENLVVGLELCLPLLEKFDRILLIEPRNTRLENKGYALSRSGDAAAVLKLVDNPHTRMLFNMYHQQISEGNILTRLEKYLPYIGHVRAAGVPKRAELDTGELSYRRIFSALEGMGYTLNVGLEYFPKRPPFEGLESCMQWRNMR